MALRYDIIGDIHGSASRLELLLLKLGYSFKNGCFSHPDRQAVFLGDYVDRGPEIRRTLQIIHSMIDRGTALGVMGNHEFNAITYNTNVEGKGWLRKHDTVNNRQHMETLRQIAAPYPSEWGEWLRWFSRLPLALELKGLRVVHAAWHAESAKLFSSEKPLTKEMIIAMADPQTVAGMARERLLSGVKVFVPSDYIKSGKRFKEGRFVRAKWWMDFRSKTYRDIAFASSSDLPTTEVPESFQPATEAYSTSDIPVFTGHYRLPYTETPRPLAPNIACLDYSVAAGGPLVAYSWCGESKLRESSFVLA